MKLFNKKKSSMEKSINNNIKEIKKYPILNQIDGIFLIFLTVFSANSFKLLGCQTQRLFKNNRIIHHFAFFCLVIFTTSFLDNVNVSPLISIFKASLVYIFLIIFTKMDLLFTNIVFFLLFILYLIHKYILYYNHKIYTIENDEEKVWYINTLNLLEKSTKLFFIILPLIITFGYIKYNIKQRNEYGKSFSSLKFLMGTNKCKNY
uniref:Uncharacterized protein n=1 Tax=viral metagenome TaxID=1070528 RepID=A0A6C0AZL4_9ZZZZ|tara:strand:+ start:40642 stop:41256 length:615 start_codon:yes stop_codon:yes gene_type:complete